MNIEELLNRSGAWMRPGEDTGIVVSSRVRLARNLKDVPFPGWGGDEVCQSVWKQLDPVLCSLDKGEGYVSAEMAKLSELDRMLLFERHLLSREHLQKGAGSGVVVRRDEHVSIMVNEEDHLRLQGLLPGLDLKAAWQMMDAVDDAIEKQVSYAFSPRLGYLTACPTNVGTGMRASVLLHVPGLVLLDEMGPIINGMSKIGLAVRGLWGEGTEATGNMFQISNQITLGECEVDIVENLEKIVAELVEHESNARLRLLEKRERMVRDHVGRAYGILSQAHLLTSKDALRLLSGLRLGVELGILNNVSRDLVDELLILSQPAHLQKKQETILDPVERDAARADLVRERLAGKEE